MKDTPQEAMIGDKAARELLSYERKLSIVAKVTKPLPAARVGLLNPAFVYIPAASTDIRARFEAIRAAQKQEKKVKTK